MFTKHIAENPEAFSHYGYGWVLQDFGGKKFIWHNGGNGVYNAFMAFAQEEDFCVIVSSNTNDIISDKVGIALFRIFSGKHIDSLPHAIMREEEPYRNNSVTLAVVNSIREKGSNYFGEHYNEVLKEAGFDFENDMHLLGVGELLMENNEIDKAVQLFTVYTKLFPRIVVAWNRLGRCYLNLNDKEKAKACFKQSVNIRSTDNPAVQLLEELN